MTDETKDPVIKAQEGWRAAESMAKLIKRHLDKKVLPGELMMFVKKNWYALAPLAHAVHEAPDNTKVPSLGTTPEATVLTQPPAPDRIIEAAVPEGRGYLSQFPMEGPSRRRLTSSS